MCQSYKYEVQTTHDTEKRIDSYVIQQILMGKSPGRVEIVEIISLKPNNIICTRSDRASPRAPPFSILITKIL